METEGNSSPSSPPRRDRQNAMDLCLGNSVPIWVTTELGLLLLEKRASFAFESRRIFW